jgi:hypothetical protein
VVKILPAKAKLFQAADTRKDRETDRHDEANIRFTQFCKLTIRKGERKFTPKEKGVDPRVDG